MKLLFENWRKYLSEARTGTLISVLERGLYNGISALYPKFTNRVTGAGGKDVGPGNLGLVSFRLASETGIKQDVKLQVFGHLYNHFEDSEIITGKMTLVPNIDRWIGAIRESELLQEIPLQKNQIAELDKRGILNGMTFVSVAFMVNDHLYDIGKDKVIGTVRGAAIDVIELGGRGNDFKDKKDIDSKNYFATMFDPLIPTFAIISLAFFPEDVNNLRKAFLNILSAITHETEHFLQTKKAGVIDSRSVAGTTFKARINYLTMPAEAEAHTAQLYFLQKRGRGPWMKLAQDYLEGQFNRVSEIAIENGMDKSEAAIKKENAIKTVLNVWIEEARKRFSKIKVPPKPEPEEISKTETDDWIKDIFREH